MQRTRKILAVLALALAGCYGTTYGYTAEYGAPYDVGPYGWYYGGWVGAHPWHAERHVRHEAHVARRRF